jgi:hypothetical protein
MDTSEAGAGPSAATSLQPDEAIEPPREDEAVRESIWIQESDRLITSDVVRAALASLLGLMLFSAIRWAIS